VGVVFEPIIRNQFAFLNIRFLCAALFADTDRHDLPIPTLRFAPFFSFPPLRRRPEKMMPLRLVKNGLDKRFPLTRRPKGPF
jgi:hypothetical protein